MNGAKIVRKWKRVKNQEEKQEQELAKEKKWGKNEKQEEESPFYLSLAAPLFCFSNASQHALLFS